MPYSSDPLVSIGMPVFNCGNTLHSSVASILNQHYQNWELILIDDGSQDRTLEIARSVKDSRIRVIDGERNCQLPARLNQAVELSTGSYFARMDGDDVSYPDRLRLQVRYLQAHPEVDLLGGGVVVFRGEGEAYGKRSPRTTHESICARPWASIGMVHPTWMGKIEWFRSNRYRPDALRMEDADLLFRTHPLSRFANLPDILLGFREDTVSLRKILPARINISKMLLDYASTGGSYTLAARGLWGQALRTVADVVAIGTGLNHRILRHRARPLKDPMMQSWAEVWSGTKATTDQMTGTLI